MKSLSICLSLVFVAASAVFAAPPGIMNHQGRIAVNGVNHDGTGWFKFAFVDATASETYWTNDGTNLGTPGGAPNTAVSLTVAKGHYAVGLGAAPMLGIPSDIFADHDDVRLRIWFSTDNLAFERLSPDRRITSTGYAFSATRLGSVSLDGLAKLNSANTATLGIALSGTYGVGNAALDGPGTLMLWYPGKAAFRAGTTTGSEWFDPEIGDFSVAFGYDTTANGAYGMAFGQGTRAEGSHATAFGKDTSAEGDLSTAFGESTRAGGELSTAFGLGTTARSFGEVALGLYNTDYAPASETLFAPNDRLFVIGNGTADTVGLRSDAMTVLKNGRVGIGTSTPTTELDVAGTVKATSFMGTLDGGSLLTGSIPTSALADNVVTMAKIADGAVGEDQLGSNAVLSTHINSDAVDRIHLKDDVIGSSELADNAVGAPHIADGQVGSAEIADNSLTATDIGPDSVGASEIIFGSITSDEIGNDAVDSPEIRANAVGSSEIAAGAVGTSEIANGSIAAADIGTGQVASEHIATNAVGVSEIAPGAVLSSHILDNSIAANDIATNAVGAAEISTGAVGTAEIADQGVRQADIGGNAVTSFAIATGAVGSFEIEDKSVSTSDIKAGAVGSTEISNDSITAADIAANAIGSSELANDSVGAVHLVSASVGSAEIANGAVASADLHSSIGVWTASSGNVYRSTGKVGIGSSSTPSHALTITTSSGNDTLRLIGSGGTFGYLARLNFGDGDHVYLDEPYDDGMTIEANEVGIGGNPSSSGQQLQVFGNASKSTAGDWLANSDRRIKMDIHPLDDALERIRRVRPVRFRYTDQWRKEHPEIDDIEYVNVIAQEFAQVFPDAVVESGETLPGGESVLQVDTYPAQIYSMAAIAELDAKLTESNRLLREENAKLRRRLEALESKLEAVVSR